MEYVLQSKLRNGRNPVLADFLIFFWCLPVVWALWLATSGIRLISFMSVGHGYLYMIIHCLAAWWGADVGARLARHVLARWQPPLWSVLVAGWLMMLVPMTFFYYSMTATFANYYPEMLPFVASMEFQWSADYPLRLLRGSLPWLCVWILVVYGYRAFAGVDWYGCGAPQTAVRTSRAKRAWPVSHHVPAAAVAPAEVIAGVEPADQVAALPAASTAVHAVPEFLRRHTKLPLDSEIVAMKAEEHYIHIWSSAGKEMIRYRFKDALAEMPPDAGLQVHRSWWVNLRHVAELKSTKRSVKLKLNNGIVVPVSQTHRFEVGALLPNY